MSGDAPVETAARALTNYLDEFYRVLYTQPMFTEQGAIERLRIVCEEMGVHDQALREYSRQRGVLAFNVKPKAHKIQHVPMLCEVMNPRCVQCDGE